MSKNSFLTRLSTIMGPTIPLLFGISVAFLYSGFKTMDPIMGGFTVIINALLILSPVSLIFFSRNIQLVSGVHLIRAVTFGLSNGLIFLSQSHISPSEGMVTALVGIAVGIMASRVILNEKIEKVTILCIPISFIGIAILGSPGIPSLMAFVSGSIQGIGATLTRYLAKKETSPTVLITTNVVVGTPIILSIAIPSGFSTSVESIFSTTSVIGVISFMIVQVLFFSSFIRHEYQRASLIALIRIPTAIVLDVIWLGIEPTGNTVVGSGLILLTSSFFLINREFLRRFPKIRTTQS